MGLSGINAVSLNFSTSQISVELLAGLECNLTTRYSRPTLVQRTTTVSVERITSIPPRSLIGALPVRSVAEFLKSGQSSLGMRVCGQHVRCSEEPDADDPNILLVFAEVIHPHPPILVAHLETIINHTCANGPLKSE